MTPIVPLSESIVSEEMIIRTMQENPDLAYEFIKNILIAKEEVRAGKLEPYVLSE